MPSVIEAALLEPRSPALQAPATCPTPLLRTAARQAATSQTRPCAEHHSFLIILGSKSFLLLRAPQRPIPAFLLFPAKAIALLLRAAQQRLLKLSLLPRWVSGLLYLSSDGDLRQEFAVKLETSSIYIFIYIFFVLFFLLLLLHQFGPYPVKHYGLPPVQKLFAKQKLCRAFPGDRGSVTTSSPHPCAHQEEPQVAASHLLTFSTRTEPAASF